MADRDPTTQPDPLDEIGHPKGTLAILAIYMLLFVLGWVGLYFFTFLPRGTPDSHAQGEAATTPAYADGPVETAAPAEEEEP